VIVCFQKGVLAKDKFFIDEYLKKVKTIRDSIALTDQDGKRSFTYGQLDIHSNKIAKKLILRGVRPGDSVIILLPRIIEYIACEIALLKLGEKRLFSGFLEEINAAYRPFTDFDLIINRYPKGYGFLVTVSSTKVSEEFAKDFISSLNENVHMILGGK